MENHVAAEDGVDPQLVVSIVMLFLSLDLENIPVAPSKFRELMKRQMMKEDFDFPTARYTLYG